MSKISHFFHLIVPQYIPMALTSLLVGAVFSISSLPDWRFWIAAFSLSCIVGGFNSFNAIADKEIDRINKPYRPIPSKKITEREALLFAALLYFVALFSAFLINLVFFVIIFISTLLTIAYSYPGLDLKKRFFFGTLSVTFFYAVLCPLAGWALYPLEEIPLSIIFFLFFFGLSLAISKDFMDMLGDSCNKANTFPVRLGYNQSIGFVFLFLTFSFGFLIFLVSQKILRSEYLFILIFFPLLILNINILRRKTILFTKNNVFGRTIILIIILELTLILLEIT